MYRERCLQIRDILAEELLAACILVISRNDSLNAQIADNSMVASHN